jgi:hypothetical protein
MPFHSLLMCLEILLSIQWFDMRYFIQQPSQSDICPITVTFYWNEIKAGEALGAIGSNECIPILQEFSHDPTPEVLIFIWIQSLRWIFISSLTQIFSLNFLWGCWNLSSRSRTHLLEATKSVHDISSHHNKQRKLSLSFIKIFVVFIFPDLISRFVWYDLVWMGLMHEVTNQTQMVTIRCIFQWILLPLKNLLILLITFLTSLTMY